MNNNIITIDLIIEAMYRIGRYNKVFIGNSVYYYLTYQDIAPMLEGKTLGNVLASAEETQKVAIRLMENLQS
jgi:hypothetical protein